MESKGNNTGKYVQSHMFQPSTLEHFPILKYKVEPFLKSLIKKGKYNV